MNNIPAIPLGEWVESSLDWLTDVLSPLTRAASAVVETGIDNLVDLLLIIPPWILILIIAGVAWKVAGRNVMFLALFGFLFVWNIGLWEPTVATISLVFFATILAVLLGVPLGILAALSDGFYAFIKPVLDFMQTMPAFVYLIPAIPFFGLGPVSAVFATVIFAVPPAIRLTALGIRQIDIELIEGLVPLAIEILANRRQKLHWICLQSFVLLTHHSAKLWSGLRWCPLARGVARHLGICGGDRCGGGKMPKQRPAASPSAGRCAPQASWQRLRLK